MEWYNYPDWNNFREQYSFALYPVNGDDIPVPFNTPISAIFPATVSSEYYDASGGTVILKADDPSQLKGVPYYYFAHLDSIGVSPGQHVAAGDQVGLSGGQLSGGQHPASPQYSSGPHIMIGESKTGTIPYTLDTLTTDLNPRWILDYARNSNIVTNPNSTIVSNPTALSTPTGTGKCICDPGYSLVQGGLGQSVCRNNNFPYDTRPCKELGVTDPLTQISQFFQSISTLTQWLNNPIRIIKLISGIILIGGAIFLIASPQSQIAQDVAKGVRKVGIH